MKIDVAICTWNRAALLSRTLESIKRATIPAGTQVRIIVVNNNSTDETSNVVTRFSESVQSGNESCSLSVELVDEVRQGHTFSRNRAVSVADGDLMLWTDDDVLVDANWFVSYADAAYHSEHVFWGGKIVPKFEPDEPDWIAENWEALKGCFAARDLGSQPIELGESKLPYGANFAIRTAIQKKFLYNTELGRRENAVLGEDEIDLFKRLIHNKFSGGWVPESRVQHLITHERASEKFVRSYFIGQGRAMVARGEPWTKNHRSLYWQLAAEFAKYRFKRHWAKSPAWLAHLIRSGLAEGQYSAMKDT